MSGLALRGPVSVDALEEAALAVELAIAPYPTLVAAINGVSAPELYADLRRTMTWENFLHVYRETIRLHFTIQKQTPVRTEE